MEASDIRIFKDFRNYFKELKEDGEAAVLEINILRDYLYELQNKSNYFTDTNRYRNQSNLLKLLDCVKNKMENERDIVIDLHKQLFY